MPTLIEELKALVEKYGYDPKNGGIINEDDSVCPRDSAERKEDNAHCFECGADIMDNGRPARCKDC